MEETGRLSNGRKPSPYSQDHQPILEQEEIVGHAVRAYYLYSGVADVASLTNDSAYFNALTRIWDNMASKKLYITTASEAAHRVRVSVRTTSLTTTLHIARPAHQSPTSTGTTACSSPLSDAKYADVYERALYNGVPSGVSLSGDKFFYDNPLESMGQHERQPWFGCACCPGNVTRFMASVPQYMYATQGDDVLVNLYIQSTADIKTIKQQREAASDHRLPWNGAVSMDVDPEKEGEFALRLRIPGWAQDAPVPTDLYSYVEKPSAKYEPEGERREGECHDRRRICHREARMEEG